jgi:hypothetical protein
MFVSLAVAVGLLLTTNVGTTQAGPVAATSPAVVSHPLVQKAGDFEYCYWKVKKNGKLKLKCKD